MQTHSSVARRSLVLPLILIASTLLSCEDDPTRPSTSDFALTVTVTEPDGTPVPGLDVVVWNISRQLITFLQDDFFGRRAVTTLRFELAAPGRCWLTVTDVAGRVVQTIFAGEELPAGTHQVLFGPEIDYIAGVAVFAAELVVHDLEPDVERFRQSRWMTMVELDRQRLTLPRTDAEGRVVLRDPRYAPGLVVTEAMPAIDENGDHMGSFVIGDSMGPSRVFPATDLLYQNAPNPFDRHDGPCSPTSGQSHPHAGVRRIPHAASTPAASGIATML
jgi:hypothetical protein